MTCCFTKPMPRKLFLHLVTTLLILSLVALPALASAEWYVGGYGGWSMPDKLKNVKMDTLGERIALANFPGAAAIPPQGTLTQSFQTSDLGLKQSALFGGKAGYFFSDEGFRWLGVELEAFTSKPSFKAQTVNTTQDITYLPFNPLPPGICQPGITCEQQTRNRGTLQITEENSLRLIVVAFNVVARYPGKILQPYVGIGAGAFYFKGSNQFNGRQVVPGVNLQTGLKILVTEEWGFFVEGKYNRATVSNFDPNNGLSGEYSAFNAVAGLEFHF
jgi:opacity protein-like surface antigen